jgi:formate dehydrogenase major subunit
MYRAPFSDKWERLSLDLAMDRIAELTKEARDEEFVERRDGVVLNQVTNLMSLGGATLAHVCVFAS